MKQGKRFDHAVKCAGSMCPLAAGALLLGIALLAAGGCELVAYPMSAFESRKIPAVFQITDRKTLILIDDPRRQFEDTAIRNRIAEVMAFHLKEGGAVKQVIPNEKLMTLAEADPEKYAKMSIHDVGAALGAEQVIHVRVRQVIMSSDPGIKRPAGSAWVKVWDVTAKQRAFPTNNDDGTTSHLAQVQMRYQQGAARGAGARYVLVRDFADYFGEEIAGLLYDRKKPPPGKLAEELQ